MGNHRGCSSHSADLTSSGIFVTFPLLHHLLREHDHLLAHLPTAGKQGNQGSNKREDMVSPGFYGANASERRKNFGVIYLGMQAYSNCIILCTSDYFNLPLD